MGIALYLLLFAAATLPGMPVGRALLGPRHPASYAAGAVLGYAFTTIALWLAIASSATSATGFLSAWVAACAFGLVLGRWTPRLPIFTWTRGDALALVLLWALTLAVALPPLLRVGQPVPGGGRLYRAYFTADFVWHMSLAAEIGKFQLPLRNPYLVDEPIHYYWGFFIVPSVTAARAPRPLRSVETCLKGNAIATGLLFTLVLYVLARLAVPKPAAAGIAVALAFCATSAEGLYEISYLWSHHRPLNLLRQTNIDAITSWRFQGLRIDGLQRCLWYVPQHTMAYAAGMLAIIIAACGSASGAYGAIFVAGFAIAASVLCNPLVGGIFALGYGGMVLIHHIRARQLRRVALHALAVVPVVAALWWCSANHMLEGSAHALTLGFYGLARHAPVATLALSMGPLLAVALVGTVARRPEVPLHRATPALLLIPLCLAIMYLVHLDVDMAYIGFRTGHIVICLSVMLVARAAMGLLVAGMQRLATAVVLLAAVLAGAPTLAIDWFNARDTSNRERSMGGFHWTIEVTHDEQDALRWLQRLTPPNAVVQMEPVCRGRETWSLIPSFAERRMAAGLPISLLHVRAYDVRSREVQMMYATEDAQLAHDLAERLHVDYIYADRVERAAYPKGIAKFDMHPELFHPVFANREVTIYSMR